DWLGSRPHPQRPRRRRPAHSAHPPVRHPAHPPARRSSPWRRRRSPEDPRCPSPQSPVWPSRSRQRPRRASRCRQSGPGWGRCSLRSRRTPRGRGPRSLVVRCPVPYGIGQPVVWWSVRSPAALGPALATGLLALDAGGRSEGVVVGVLAVAGGLGPGAPRGVLLALQGTRVLALRPLLGFPLD